MKLESAQQQKQVLKMEVAVLKKLQGKIFSLVYLCVFPSISLVRGRVCVLVESSLIAPFACLAPCVRPFKAAAADVDSCLTVATVSRLCRNVLRFSASMIVSKKAAAKRRQAIRCNPEFFEPKEFIGIFPGSLYYFGTYSVNSEPCYLNAEQFGRLPQKVGI